MAFTVVYDACVLYPAGLCDLLVRLAMTDLVRARWSDQILDEVFRNILENEPMRKAASLTRTRELMNVAVRDGLVTGHEALIDSLTLPDPDDRHVLAAAIRCGAQAVVTFNRKDFPARTLAPFGIEVKHPDDFVFDLLDIDEDRVADVVRAQAAALKKPPMTLDELATRLADHGLKRTARRLRGLLGLSR
jgi:predicted nucleic acid-binding protein